MFRQWGLNDGDCMISADSNFVALSFFVRFLALLSAFQLVENNGDSDFFKLQDVRLPGGTRIPSSMEHTPKSILQQNLPETS
jgi:hypothetical protein